MDDDEDLEFLRLQALKSLNNKKEITYSSSSLKEHTQRNAIHIVKSQLHQQHLQPQMIKFPLSQQNHTVNERKMLLCDTTEPYIPQSVNVSSHWGTIDDTSNGFVHYVPAKIGVDDTSRLTKVQLSPRSAAFVSENNDILRKRIGGGGTPVSSRSPTPKHLNSHRLSSCDRWSHSPTTTQVLQQSSMKLVNRRSTTPFIYRGKSLSKSPPPLSPPSHHHHTTNKRRVGKDLSPIHRRMSRLQPPQNTHLLSSRSPQSHHTLSSYLNQNKRKSTGLSQQRNHSRSPDSYHMVRHQNVPDFHKSTSRSPPPSSPQKNRKFSYVRNRSPYNKRNSPPYYQENFRQCIPNNYQNSKQNVRRSSPNHSNSQSYNKNNNNRPRSLTPPSVHPPINSQRSKINRNISPSSSSSNYQRPSGNRRRSRSPYNNNKSTEITRRSLSRSPQRNIVKKSRDFNTNKKRKLSASESRPTILKYNIRSSDTNSRIHRTNANNKMNERYRHSYNSNQKAFLKSSTKRTSPTKKTSNSRSISRTPPLENIDQKINHSNTPPLPPITSPIFQLTIPLEQFHTTKLNDNKSQQDNNNDSNKSKDTTGQIQSKSIEKNIGNPSEKTPQICQDYHIENFKATSDDDDDADTNDELEDGIDLFASEESESENEGRFKSNNGKTARTTSASTVSFSKLGRTATTDIRELNDMNNENDEKATRIRNNPSRNRYYSTDRKGDDKFRKLNTRNLSQYSSNRYNKNNSSSSSSSRHNWRSTKSNSAQSQLSSSNSNNNLQTNNGDPKKCNDNSTSLVVQTELLSQQSKSTIDNVLKKIPPSVIEKPQQTIDNEKMRERKTNVQLKRTNMIEEKEKPLSNNTTQLSALRSIDKHSTSLYNLPSHQESTEMKMIGTSTTAGNGQSSSMGTTIVKKSIHLRLGAMTKTWESKKVWKSTSPTNNTTTVTNKVFKNETFNNLAIYIF